MRLHGRSDWLDDDRDLVVRFERLFTRTPTAEEAVRFRRAHRQLVLGIPASARRRAAAVITRL